MRLCTVFLLTFGISLTYVFTAPLEKRSANPDEKDTSEPKESTQLNRATGKFAKFADQYVKPVWLSNKGPKRHKNSKSKPKEQKESKDDSNKDSDKDSGSSTSTTPTSDDSDSPTTEESSNAKKNSRKTKKRNRNNNSKKRKRLNGFKMGYITTLGEAIGVFQEDRNGRDEMKIIMKWNYGDDIQIVLIEPVEALSSNKLFKKHLIRQKRDYGSQIISSELKPRKQNAFTSNEDITEMGFYRNSKLDSILKKLESNKLIGHNEFENKKKLLDQSPEEGNSMDSTENAGTELDKLRLKINGPTSDPQNNEKKNQDKHNVKNVNTKPDIPSNESLKNTPNHKTMENEKATNIKPQPNLKQSELNSQDSNKNIKPLTKQNTPNYDKPDSTEIENQFQKINSKPIKNKINPTYQKPIDETVLKGDTNVGNNFINTPKQTDVDKTKNKIQPKSDTKMNNFSLETKETLENHPLFVDPQKKRIQNIINNKKNLVKKIPNMPESLEGMKSNDNKKPLLKQNIQEYGEPNNIKIENQSPKINSETIKNKINPILNNPNDEPMLKDDTNIGKNFINTPKQTDVDKTKNKIQPKSDTKLNDFNPETEETSEDIPIFKDPQKKRTQNNTNNLVKNIPNMSESLESMESIGNKKPLSKQNTQEYGNPNNIKIENQSPKINSETIKNKINPILKNPNDEKMLKDDTNVEKKFMNTPKQTDVDKTKNIIQPKSDKQMNDFNPETEETSEDNPMFKDPQKKRTQNNTNNLATKIPNMSESLESMESNDNKKQLGNNNPLKPKNTEEKINTQTKQFPGEVPKSTNDLVLKIPKTSTEKPDLDKMEGQVNTPNVKHLKKLNKINEVSKKSSEEPMLNDNIESSDNFLNLSDLNEMDKSLNWSTSAQMRNPDDDLNNSNPTIEKLKKENQIVNGIESIPHDNIPMTSTKNANKILDSPIRDPILTESELSTPDPIKNKDETYKPSTSIVDDIMKSVPSKVDRSDDSKDKFFFNSIEKFSDELGGAVLLTTGSFSSSKDQTNKKSNEIDSTTPKNSAQNSSNSPEDITDKHNSVNNDQNLGKSNTLKPKLATINNGASEETFNSLILNSDEDLTFNKLDRSVEKLSEPIDTPTSAQIFGHNDDGSKKKLSNFANNEPNKLEESNNKIKNSKPKSKSIEIVTQPNDNGSKKIKEQIQKPAEDKHHKIDDLDNSKQHKTHEDPVISSFESTSVFNPFKELSNKLWGTPTNEDFNLNNKNNEKLNPDEKNKNTLEMATNEPFSSEQDFQKPDKHDKPTTAENFNPNTINSKTISLETPNNDVKATAGKIQTPVNDVFFKNDEPNDSSNQRISNQNLDPFDSLGDESFFHSVEQLQPQKLENAPKADNLILDNNHIQPIDNIHTPENEPKTKLKNISSEISNNKLSVADDKSPNPTDDVKNTIDKPNGLNNFNPNKSFDSFNSLEDKSLTSNEKYSDELHELPSTENDKNDEKSDTGEGNLSESTDIQIKVPTNKDANNGEILKTDLNDPIKNTDQLSDESFGKVEDTLLKPKSKEISSEILNSSSNTIENKIHTPFDDNIQYTTDKPNSFDQHISNKIIDPFGSLEGESFFDPINLLPSNKLQNSSKPENSVPINDHKTAPTIEDTTENNLSNSKPEHDKNTSGLSNNNLVVDNIDNLSESVQDATEKPQVKNEFTSLNKSHDPFKSLEDKSFSNEIFSEDQQNVPINEESFVKNIQNKTPVTSEKTNILQENLSESGTTNLSDLSKSILDETPKAENALKPNVETSIESSFQPKPSNTAVDSVGSKETVDVMKNNLFKNFAERFMGDKSDVDKGNVSGNNDNDNTKIESTNEPNKYLETINKIINNTNRLNTIPAPHSQSDKSSKDGGKQKTITFNPTASNHQHTNIYNDKTNKVPLISEDQILTKTDNKIVNDRVLDSATSTTHPLNEIPEVAVDLNEKKSDPHWSNFVPDPFKTIYNYLQNDNNEGKPDESSTGKTTPANDDELSYLADKSSDQLPESIQIKEKIIEKPTVQKTEAFDKGNNSPTDTFTPSLDSSTVNPPEISKHFENQNYNPYGFMIPKFNAIYEGGSSDDLWESTPPKQNKNFNDNNELDNLSNIFNGNKIPNENYSTNNKISSQVNNEELNTQNENIKNSLVQDTDEKPNIDNNNEFLNEYLKNMAEKVMNRIDDIDDKIAKLNLLSNGEIDNDGNEDKKTDDPKSIKYLTTDMNLITTKNKINSIEPDSKLNETVEKIEELDESESDEGSEIKEHKKNVDKKKKSDKKEKRNENNRNNENTKSKKRRNNENRKDKHRKKHNNKNVSNDSDDVVEDKVHRKHKKPISSESAAEDISVQRKVSHKRKKENKTKKKITLYSSEEDNNVNYSSSNEITDSNYDSVSDLKVSYKSKKSKKIKESEKKPTRKSNSKHSKQPKDVTKHKTRKKSVRDDSSYDEDEPLVSKKRSVKVYDEDDEIKESKKKKKRKKKKKKKKENNTDVKTINENDTQVIDNGSDDNTSNGYEYITFYPEIQYRNPFSRLYM